MLSKVENFFQFLPCPDSFGGQQIDPKYRTCHRMTTFCKHLLLHNRNSSAPSERYPSLSEFFRKFFHFSLAIFWIFFLNFRKYSLVIFGIFFLCNHNRFIIKREHHNDIFYFSKFSFFRVTDFVSKLFFRSVDHFV